MTSIAPIALPPPVPPEATLAVVVAPSDVARPAPETLIRRPVRDADHIDRFLRRSQRPNDALGSGRRRSGAERSGGLRRPARQARAQQAPFTPSQATHSSAFIAQFIAQEVIPHDERARPGFHDEGIAAYETTTSRARVYFGPNQPVEVRA